MLTLLNWLGRWALTSRLKVKQAWLNRQARRSPHHFRQLIQLDPDHTQPFQHYIQPWQQNDFQALDPAWQQLANSPQRAAPDTPRTEATDPTPTVPSLHHSIPQSLNPFLHSVPGHSTLDIRPSRAWIERPRGHSKTSDIALQIAWILLYSPHARHGIAAAADRDQANLLAEALQRIARLNPYLFEPLVFHKHKISNPDTGSQLEILSSDVKSSWGQLPDFIICDELCHWENPELWHALFSSAAKRPHCLLIVLTNAGVGREWHWETREAARHSPRWHFSSLEGPQAPWITPDLLEEQRQLLPETVFNRLWLNQWQHAEGNFVTLEQAEACRDESLQPQTHGQPGTHYYAAIDYAERHDHTAAILLHSSDPQPSTLHPQPSLTIDRLDLHIPTPDNPTPVAWVENWIREIAKRFHHVTFILDEYQLVGTIQALQNEHEIHRFPFRAGKGNHDLAQNLRTLILQKRLRWYPHCGQLPSTQPPPSAKARRPRPAGSNESTQSAALGALGAEPDNDQLSPNPQSAIRNPQSATPRNDLETELANLILRQAPSGLCRIDHKHNHHDDRSFALGAAALYALQQPANEPWLEITPPTIEGDFNF